MTPPSGWVKKEVADMVSLRTITILMLLAGVSLGVFAGTLMADRSNQLDENSRVEQAIDEQLDWYKVRYGLSDPQAERVRTELVRYRQKFHEQLRDLWRDNEEAFRALSEEKGTRIEAIVGAKSEQDSD